MEIAARPKPISISGHCKVCGQVKNHLNLSLHQNTGVIIQRYSKTYSGEMCRDCAKELFYKVQLHNLLFGWWGTISFFVTAANLCMNTVSYIGYSLKFKKTFA